MNCEDVKELIGAFADGELDPANHLQAERHLAECPACDAEYQKLAGLRSALADDTMYFRAPDRLREKVLSSMRENENYRAAAKPRAWSWTPVFAAAALAAIVLAAFLLLRPTASSEDLLAKEIVSAHVRSMMTDNHLTDVISTDQHTVKPWFEGKLDFAPLVVDLASRGFTLKGGRLDYVANRPVAALVYQRRQHAINLFIFPSDESETGNKMLARQGFNLVHWDKAGMAFWAVSDMNLAELQEFAQAIRDQS